VRVKQVSFTVVSLLVLTACARAAPGPRLNEPADSGAQSLAGRVLTMAVRHEPTDFSPKIAQAAAGGSIKPLLNAGLVLVDDEEASRLQLAERLPQLNTDTWRVFPDGRMETTYRLKPDLAWHDGAVLTADDFVFAWQIYRHPGLGTFSPKPQDRIDEVAAPDPATVVIRWSSIYPDAGILNQEDFPALPRHVLAESFAAFEADGGKREQFLNQPYWTTEFVGTGPYRFERWEPGATLEVRAFDRYALGKPAIDRIVVRFMSDENSVLTSMLAGQVQLCYQYCLRFEHAQVLQREWSPGQAGSILLAPNAGTFVLIQFRPEYQKTPALLDSLVRRALVHAIDRQALLDGLFEGTGTVPFSHIPPDRAYYRALEPTLGKYAYDPRRSEQLMNEAGLTRDREGVYADETGQRFQPDFTALAGAASERAQAIMVDTWRRAGIETRPTILPNAQVRDGQARHTFSGLGWSVGGAEEAFTSEQIGTPGNRWGGSNRGGWSNAEYDRLWGLYNTTLDSIERDRQLIRMAQVVDEQLPIFILYFNYSVVAHIAAISGPRARTLWNVHEWQIR
jgi:peptide/nickel transport system substrate-binding protein